MGATKISEYSLSTQLGSSSGPLAREVLISRSFFHFRPISQSQLLVHRLQLTPAQSPSEVGNLS
mgnify:CR=1 FL=1